MPSKRTKKDTLAGKSEYWRLRAELLALRDMLGATFVRSTGLHDAKSKAFKKAQAGFDASYEKLVAFHFSKILLEIEDISPRLAAELDDRSPDEIDTH